MASTTAEPMLPRPGAAAAPGRTVSVLCIHKDVATGCRKSKILSDNCTAEADTRTDMTGRQCRVSRHNGTANANNVSC